MRPSLEIDQLNQEKSWYMRLGPHGDCNMQVTMTAKLHVNTLLDSTLPTHHMTTTTHAGCRGCASDTTNRRTTLPDWLALKASLEDKLLGKQLQRAAAEAAKVPAAVRGSGGRASGSPVASVGNATLGSVWHAHLLILVLDRCLQQRQTPGQFCVLNF